jgi:hypothetical protein
VSGIFCCDIPWYSTIVTVILRFFVMNAYAFATSPGHLSQLSFCPVAPSFIVLSLSTSNSRQLATCAAIEFICPIHRDPSPSYIRFIEFIHPAMVIRPGKSQATEVASTKDVKSPATAEVASGHVTRSTRNAGTFASAEPAVTKTASARNAGAFASVKAAVTRTASLVAPHMEEDTSAKAINSPIELVDPGKSPPVHKANNKAIATVATDLNATALAKDSSSKTVMTATKVAKVAVSKKVCIMFSYFFMNSYILLSIL